MKHPLERDLDHVREHTAGLWDALRGKSLFITGGTGFVGTWLLESLAWADDRFELGVKAVALTRDPDAFRVKAPYAAGHQAIRLLRGDAVSFEYPDGDFEFVIHAATEKQVASTADDPSRSFDRDVTATRRLLEFARTHGTKRLLFTSSGAIYGKQPADLANTPEDYAGAPVTTDLASSYGQAKRVSEFLCTMYARQYGFDAPIARLFAFVGPHLPTEGFAVGNFVRDALQGREIVIESDGTTVRSYLYAADLAIWLWTILLRGESARPYNVGSPEAITVRELAQTVADVAAPGTQVRVLGRAGVPATRYVPSTERAEKELGLRPLVSLEEALRRTVKWHRANASKSAGEVA